MANVKDKLWIWGHEAGSHNNQYGINRSSRMTPAEGALYLGVPNLIMVRYKNRPAPPFNQYAMALSSLKRVVWSVVGAAGITEDKEVAEVHDIASQFPNICGFMMDDFFKGSTENNRSIAVFTPDEISAIKNRLSVSGKKLELWVVIYDHQLDLPVGEHLTQCDVVSFWTWEAKNLKNLEKNFEQVEKLAPSCRKVLGCYMYDYGDSKPIPVLQMEAQCTLALKWLRQGRIEGIIFLVSCICDLELEAVEWTRQWIKDVGEENLM